MNIPILPLRDRGFGPRKSIQRRWKNRSDTGATPIGGRCVLFGALVDLQVSQDCVYDFTSLTNPGQ